MSTIKFHPYVRKGNYGMTHKEREQVPVRLLYSNSTTSQYIEGYDVSDLTTIPYVCVIANAVFDIVEHVKGQALVIYTAELTYRNDSHKYAFGCIKHREIALHRDGLGVCKDFKTVMLDYETGASNAIKQMLKIVSIMGTSVVRNGAYLADFDISAYI